LREYLDDFAITYLDDILIYSDDLEMHRSHVHKVLRKLNERALYVKKSKSRFETKEIKFLIILFNLSKSRRTQKDGRSQKLASAKRVKKVQAFLELTNYYQSLYLIMQRLQNPHTTNAQEQG
jgi:hypothetical protein